MLDIRPVSDLRNKFSEIEETVKSGQPVYLTKMAMVPWWCSAWSSMPH